MEADIMDAAVCIILDQFVAPEAAQIPARTHITSTTKQTTV
jgi:hypothetical protein